MHPATQRAPRGAAVRLYLLPWGILAGALPALAAQTTSTVDVGVSTVWFRGDQVSSLTVAPGIHTDGTRGSLDVGFGLSRFNTGQGLLQGSLAGTLLTPPAGGFRLEVGGRAEGSQYQAASGAGKIAGTLRLRFERNRVGLWAGGFAGRGWDGVTPRTLRGAEVGARIHLGETTLSGSVAPTALGSTMRYTDMESVLHWRRGELEASGFAGLRSWRDPAGVPVEGWGGGALAVWVSERVAAIAGAGAYPADYGQGFPSGRYFTLMVRIASRLPSDGRMFPRQGPQGLPPRDRPVATGFQLKSAGEGRWRLVVRNAGAGKVEVAGDFTDWRLISLQRIGSDRWEVELPISSGIHRLNLRVDGGPWGVPDGLPTVHDEFGGTVGLLTVR